MSYILDALKKSEAEKAGEAVGLNPQQSGMKRPSITWIASGLAVILAVNIILLGYIFLDRLPPSKEISASPTTISNVPLEQTADELGRTPPVVTAGPPPQASVKIQPEIAPGKRQLRSNDNPTLLQEKPSKVIEQVKLFDLPASEQLLYTGFKYSSHIYTDDPALCNIVIDGQTLGAGDAFKGLTVHAINEEGVVFLESRRGQQRLVAVSIIEVWDL